MLHWQMMVFNPIKAQSTIKHTEAPYSKQEWKVYSSSKLGGKWLWPILRYYDSTYLHTYKKSMIHFSQVRS
jgi:hypothetical protein